MAIKRCAFVCFKRMTNVCVVRDFVAIPAVLCTPFNGVEFVWKSLSSVSEKRVSIERFFFFFFFFMDSSFGTWGRVKTQISKTFNVGSSFADFMWLKPFKHCWINTSTEPVYPWRDFDVVYTPMELASKRLVCRLKLFRGGSRLFPLFKWE